MDESAIKEIKKDNVVTSQIKAIEELDIPTIVLPNGFALHHLENYMEAPVQFKGTYLTSIISEFAKYVRKNDACICFVSPEHAVAEAVFDLGNENSPGHGRHKSKIKLETTAEYAEQIELEGKALPQVDFAEFLQDWQDYITVIDQNGNEMKVNSAIASAREVTLKSTQNSDYYEGEYHKKRTATEEIEATAKHGIPAFVTFKLTPYEDFKEREFVMRVSLLTQGNAPLFKLRTIQLQLIKEAIAKEFQEKINKELKDENIVMHIGTFSK